MVALNGTIAVLKMNVEDFFKISRRCDKIELGLLRV